jgi:hypothetical protein
MSEHDRDAQLQRAKSTLKILQRVALAIVHATPSDAPSAGDTPNLKSQIHDERISNHE